MTHQHEFTSAAPLLGEDGCLPRGGWSRSMLLEYSRDALPPSRRYQLKEWDYYLFGNSDWQIALTINDNGYMGMVSASVISLKEKWDVTRSAVRPFTFGRMGLPSSTNHGDIVYRHGDIGLNIERGHNERRIALKWNNFDGAKSLYINVTLQVPRGDSLVLALPFKNRSQFYYNQKINCLRADGKVVYGGIDLTFNSADTFGCLDWGRGIWPRHSVWVWCSASGILEGKEFGLNLGGGFGIRKDAGENIFYCDGQAYKMGEVQIIPARNFKKDAWRFICEREGEEVDLRFEPVYERFAAPGLLGIVKSVQHQCFGHWYGHVRIVQEGQPALDVELDGLPGMAEQVENKW